ncbi:MAG: hypothetical protein QXW35_04100 [Candidatus Aenigmatarchaeota archaeon]
MVQICICDKNKIIYRLDKEINQKKAESILKAIEPIIQYNTKEIESAIKFWIDHIEHMNNVEERKNLEKEKEELKSAHKKLPSAKENRLKELEKIKHGRPAIYLAIASAIKKYINQRIKDYKNEYIKTHPNVNEKDIEIPEILKRASFTDKNLIEYIEKEVPKILKYPRSKSRYKLTRRVFFKSLHYI